MIRSPRIVRIEDYEPLIGAEAVDRIRKKAGALRDLRTVHISSTYYGGGVAEMLSSLTLLMNSLGIKTGWRVLEGAPDFFSVTKEIHNALQGEEINLSERKKEIYEGIVYENAFRNHLDQDIIVIHDPQPLPMINYYRKKCLWIWRCHVDLSSPNREMWNYLLQFIKKYDTAIFSLREYAQDIAVPQVFFLPAINPFSGTNREMSQEEIDERLDHYHIPGDLPLVAQISRFDRWKDPQGVIRAFKLARKEAPCTLVLLGNVATDDPEGEEVYNSLLGCQEERIIILSVQDTALVNALQRRCAVIVQKSLREGFGLTVAESMWKGTPVIGGNIGGIRCQITNGVNGFLVSSVEEAAERIVQVVRDKELRQRLGEHARETVKRKFLLSRNLEQYLNLFSSFELKFHLKAKIEDICE